MTEPIELFAARARRRWRPAQRFFSSDRPTVTLPPSLLSFYLLSLFPFLLFSFCLTAFFNWRSNSLHRFIKPTLDSLKSFIIIAPLTAVHA
jgi:uncharacterized BrkB/YihY/UPF0761 family membrane protein